MQISVLFVSDEISFLVARTISMTIEAMSNISLFHADSVEHAEQFVLDNEPTVIIVDDENFLELASCHKGVTILRTNDKTSYNNPNILTVEKSNTLGAIHQMLTLACTNAMGMKILT